MEKITIEFGKGFYGIMDGIMNAVFLLRQQYVDDKEITIYLPESVKRMMEIEHPAPTAFDSDYSMIQGITVVKGYEEGVVIVSAEKGFYYNIQPIRIDVEMVKITED